ncbi:MAG: NAD(P)-binding protein [Burkholderiales bacterium]|nr:NAD(P)-binding protein [Burkholderiales bacterium]
MNTDREVVRVVGAGPAGLAAAITLARAGRSVVVHEAQQEVGHRFGADLQGLENWSTKGDVLEALRDAGITTAFEALPFAQATAFDAWDRRHEVQSAQPLFYLVERGPGKGTLDAALFAQALALGVDVRFGSRMTRLEGPGILAVGPKAADAIAVGYHFETDMPDGVWLVLDDAVAPQGYSYLLVMRGRGTVKSCMFTGFKQERLYVERTLERFRRLVGLEMRNPRPHGGVGNFRVPATAVSGAHPVAGEQAGFQDAFAGFGMRYAILSGVLAARALLDVEDYDALWRREIEPVIAASVVNRAVYSALGNRGYRWLLRSQAWSADARRFLRRLYGPAVVRRALLPWANRRYRSAREDESCDHVDCTCVWCRCGGAEAAAAAS